MTNDLFPVQAELDYFGMFWGAGMRKVKKKDAERIFNKLIKKEKEPLEFTEKLVNDIKKRIALQQFGFDALHPTTYLNGERWEDEYPQPQKQLATQETKQSFQSLHDNVRF